MSWQESLSVAEYLANFGKKIIPYLQNLIKTSDKPSVYTSAIKALGYIKSEEGFKFLFSLMMKGEKRILSNPLTFGETIDAIVRCGGKHLKELMQLLNNSNWLIRSGGVYACARISAESSNNKALIVKLKKTLRSLARNDRSEKVQKLAMLSLGWITGEEEIIESYKEAIDIVQSEMPEKDLYPKYSEILKQIFNGLGYPQLPERDEYNRWNIENLHYHYPIHLALNEDRNTGEGYLRIYTLICELPEKNILAFYRKLLEWNEFYFTGTAKLFVVMNRLFIMEVRKLDSLNIEETVNAIYMLTERADEFHKYLSEEFKF